jgi:RiboL-PSP-HEPN
MLMSCPRIRVPDVPFDPHDAATHSIQRARQLLSQTSIRGVPPEYRIPYSVRTDIWRLSVVVAVAALDTYMHRLIVERVYTHEKLPPVLEKLDVPFEHVLAWADEAKVAARSEPHNSRPRVAVKRQLRDRLLRETFQNFEGVGRAMRMAGLTRNWEAIGQQFNPPMRPEEIRTRLNSVVMRRNQIVHEGDYRRLERPQDPGRNHITPRQAQLDIDFLEDLIDAIHATI